MLVCPNSSEPKSDGDCVQTAVIPKQLMPYCCYIKLK